MSVASKTENMSSSNLIIVMLLITLIVVGVSGLVAKSLIGSIVRDTKVVSKESAADKQVKKDVEAAPKLIEAYGQLGDKASVIADALPNKADFPSLIVTLENISRAAGFKLKSVAPGAVTVATPGDTSSVADVSQAPAPQSYKFSIAFTGTYASLTKMLGFLETSARPMRVLDMQLAGGGSSLSGQFDVETFYQDKAQLPFSKESVK